MTAITVGEKLMRSCDFLWTKRTLLYKIDTLNGQIKSLSRTMEQGDGREPSWWSGMLPINEIAYTRAYLADLERQRAEFEVKLFGKNWVPEIKP
jgi:hypothetical protein